MSLTEVPAEACSFQSSQDMPIYAILWEGRAAWQNVCKINHVFVGVFHL